MLYGAKTQSGLLAEGLRSSARHAADRDRMQRSADPIAVGHGTAPRTRTHPSLAAVVLRHVRPARTTHAPAR